MKKTYFSWLIAGAAILTLSLSLSAAAQDIEDIPGVGEGALRWWKDSFVRFGGVTQWQFAYDLEDDGRQEDLGESRLKISAYLDLKPWPKARFHLSLLEMGVLSGRYPDRTVKPEYVNRIPYEAYILQSLWKFDFTVGYQVVKWGANEFLSPTDNINPLDLTGFIDPDREDIVIPIPMAKAMFFITDFIFVEGVAIPYFVPGRFHQFKTDYALCQEGICPIDNDEDVEYAGPGGSDESWEYGVRFRAQASDFIFEASYLHTREDFPVYASVPNPKVTFHDVVIQSRFPEYELYGGGVAWRHGKMAIRAEGAYSPERFFATLPKDANGDSLSFVNTRGRDRPVIHPKPSAYTNWAVETEFNPSRRLYLLGGYSQFIMNDTVDFLLISSRVTSIALLMARATAMRERLVLKLGALYFIEDDEYIMTPRITYQASNQVELSVGANILEGKRGGNEDLGGVAPVSLFSNNENAFIGARYSF